MSKIKEKRLTPAEMKALPISPGEARKLLGIKDMSDDDVAREILLLSKLAQVLIKTLDLQKDTYNCIK